MIFPYYQRCLLESQQAPCMPLPVQPPRSENSRYEPWAVPFLGYGAIQQEVVRRYELASGERYFTTSAIRRHEELSTYIKTDCRLE